MSKIIIALIILIGFGWFVNSYNTRTLLLYSEKNSIPLEKIKTLCEKVEPIKTPEQLKNEQLAIEFEKEVFRYIAFLLPFIFILFMISIIEKVLTGRY